MCRKSTKIPKIFEKRIDMEEYWGYDKIVQVMS